MIKTLEVTGRTEDEALANGLKQLGLDRDEVSVTVLERSRSGFLGIGASPAKLSIAYEIPDEPAPKPVQKKPAPKTEKPAPRTEKTPTPRKPAPKTEKPAAKTEKPAAKAEKPAAKTEKPAEKSAAASDHADIREFLEGLLERMGIEAEIEIREKDPKGILVNLSGPNMGAVIGRRGETLDAIQHLTNYVINRGSEKHMHISVDAEEYRAKREESLVRLAEKMAAKVIKYKRSMALEPMNSYERHIIHTALQDYEGVSTSSTGVEPNRRVVVSYERPQPTSHKPQSREWA